MDLDHHKLITIFEGDVIQDNIWKLQVRFGLYDNGESYDDEVRGNGFYTYGSIKGQNTVWSSLYSGSRWEVIGNIHTATKEQLKNWILKNDIRKRIF